MGNAIRRTATHGTAVKINGGRRFSSLFTNFFGRGKLDGRGIYCYPGCLEGRGFDECGQHGFVVLDIDEKKRTVSDTFVPFAKRRLYTVDVDVTGCSHSVEMAECIKEQLAEASCQSSDLVKIVLNGALDVSSEKNINYLVQYFSGDF